MNSHIVMPYGTKNEIELSSLTSMHFLCQFAGTQFKQNSMEPDIMCRCLSLVQCLSTKSKTLFLAHSCAREEKKKNNRKAEGIWRLCLFLLVLNFFGCSIPYSHLDVFLPHRFWDGKCVLILNLLVLLLVFFFVSI